MWISETVIMAMVSCTYIWPYTKQIFGLVGNNNVCIQDNVIRCNVILLKQARILFTFFKIRNINPGKSRGIHWKNVIMEKYVGD